MNVRDRVGTCRNCGGDVYWGNALIGPGTDLFHATDGCAAAAYGGSGLPLRGDEVRIHEDMNGLAVNAITKTSFGKDVEGQLYQVLGGGVQLHVEFQDGPAQEVGVNGLTNEAMISILIHRLTVLNRAPWQHFENVVAINGLRAAEAALNRRTAERVKRGVEGTSTV